MRIRISHLVNSLTRQALFESVPGYVSKEVDFAALEADARQKYHLQTIHRFDLGENAEGCTPNVRQFLKSLTPVDLNHYLSGYPESAAALKAILAEIHQVPTEWIALGTGVVSFISILCHTFYEWGDRVVIPTPTFFVIEEYVLRSGALPIYMPFEHEDGFKWTPRIAEQIIHQIQCVPVKMLWLCSPNNPTGQAIPIDEIERIVAAAEETFTMVVVDEAYGEFTDYQPDFGSASRLLKRFENLIVLRSFSKAYGLAGMRIGYAMMSSPIVHDAVARQMEYFPVTKLSIELARVAAEDQAYVQKSRVDTRNWMVELQAAISGLPKFECVHSQTNIYLLRRKGWSTRQLTEALLKRGVLVANADIEGLSGHGWVRVTCRQPDNNTYLLQQLSAI